MPSAPTFTAARTSSTVPALPSNCTGVPSDKRPGPVTDSARALSFASFSERVAISSEDASTMTSPPRPSTRTVVPSARSMTPAQPTIAGMPRPRATIAVWLVAPPCEQTSASANFKLSAAVSAGVRSSATTIVGAVSVSPALSMPASLLIRRVWISSISLTRSAKYPPRARSCSLNPPKAASTMGRTSNATPSVIAPSRTSITEGSRAIIACAPRTSLATSSSIVSALCSRSAATASSAAKT